MSGPEGDDASRSFRVLALEHTGLSVGSLKAALPFWTDVLGFTLERRGEIAAGPFLGEVAGARGHALRFAILYGHGHTVELTEYHNAPRDIVGGGVTAIGSAHLSFFVDDLDAALGAVSLHGYAPLGQPQTLTGGPRAGTRVIFIRNGDGTLLELKQPA